MVDGEVEGEAFWGGFFQLGMNGVVVEAVREIVEFLEEASGGEGPVRSGVGGSSLKTEVGSEESHSVPQEEKVMGRGGNQGVPAFGVRGHKEDIGDPVFGS